jgi:plasmid stabilization system protein ParE
MIYKVEISPTALNEIDEAYLWIFERSPAGAARWFRRLKKAIDTLETNPRRCSLAPESDAFPLEVRQLLLGKPPNVYRVLFTIEESTIRIQHVRHAAQDYLTPP